MRMTRNRSCAIDLGNTEWPKVDTTRKTHQEKLATLQFSFRVFRNVYSNFQ